MATNNQNNTNRPSNYVILTLRAIADGASQYAQSGKPWAKVRAFLSQGKDESGEYRPSVFFDVKAFSKDENLGGAVAAIASIANKSYFTVKGRLARYWRDKHPSSFFISSHFNFSRDVYRLPRCACFMVSVTCMMLYCSQISAWQHQK